MMNLFVNDLKNAIGITFIRYGLKLNCLNPKIAKNSLSIF